MRLILRLIAARPALAQNPGDWPTYNRDLASTRYSALKQINTGNVTQLVTAWSYKLRPDANSRVAGTVNEGTPIVVERVLSLPAGNRVLALDPDTGVEIWRYELKTGAASQRGVAYWPGDKDNPARILFTAGHKMVALNAKTGKLDPGFGNEGELTMDVPFAGVPTIYKNVILVGMNMFGPGEEHLHQQDELPGGMPGDSRAYDVRTGKKLWDFHAVPLPGEVGHDDWKEGNWKRSGNNMWSYAITVDEKRGIVYMPMGGPAANYYGGDRKGNNLFANAVVAVDYQTGKLKWYFQTVHHELWDYDLPPDPVLVDIVKDGKKIPALVQTGKSGYMFILVRVTGQPVFGVEERPVPAGNVPGEWYSPTQPFPLKPPALTRTSYKPEDMVTAADTSPEHVKACQDFVEKSGGFYNAGPFTPFLFHETGALPKSTLIFPGNGGANWGGTAADPKTGFVYVQTHDQALVGWVEKKDPKGNYGSGNGSPQLYDRGSVDGPGPYHGFSAQVKDANRKTIGDR